MSEYDDDEGTWKERYANLRRKTAGWEDGAKNWEILTSRPKYAPVVEMIEKLDNGTYKAEEPGKQSASNPDGLTPEEIREWREWTKYEKQRVFDEWNKQVTQNEEKMVGRFPELKEKGVFGPNGSINQRLQRDRLSKWEDAALLELGPKYFIDNESNGGGSPAPQKSESAAPAAVTGAPVGGTPPGEADYKPDDWHDFKTQGKERFLQEHGGG